MFSLSYKLLLYIYNNFVKSEIQRDLILEKTFDLTNRTPKDAAYQSSTTGTVTKINSFESYGLIDNFIYFHFDVVSGHEKVKIGDTVSVTAYKHHAQHGWRASNVQVQHDLWETDNIEALDSLAQASPSGKLSSAGSRIIQAEVTKCYGTFGLLNNAYKFENKNCKVDFKPIVGDLVTADLRANNSITSWTPRYLKDIEGVVTICEEEFGIVNEKIIFYFRSCRCDSKISCGQKVLARVVESHQQSFACRAYELITVVEKAEETKSKPCFVDQPELLVTNNLDFDVVEVGQEKVISVTIRNNGTQVLKFLNCQFQNDDGDMPFSIPKPEKAIMLPSGAELVLELSCCCQTMGLYKESLVLEFDKFCISRIVVALVSASVKDLIGPTAPFTKSKPNVKIRMMDEDSIVVPGKKVVPLKANFAGFKPNHLIPRQLWRIIENTDNLVQALPVLKMGLHRDNYVEKLSCLLHLEEIQMIEHLRNFDRFEVVLSRRGEYLSLEVPGLAEGRPSLLIGDKAMLHPPKNSSNIIYEGYIHEVHKDDIFLKFHEEFQHNYNGEIFDVSFKVSRSNMRRMHEGINVVAHSNIALLFPNHTKFREPLINVNCKSGIAVDIIWQNGILNNGQKRAVSRVLESCCRPLPYVIFGPPGTGKTITLVETVLQFFLTVQHKRILICAPSNSAADLITQKLVESEVVSSQHLVRLNSFNRSTDSIPEQIKSFCQNKSTVEEVYSFTIIVSTISTAGVLQDLQLPKDHFTHVFIDEAGQLMEPEVMVPLSLVVNYRKAQIVLTGDPMQLGPILMSDLAKKFGLQVSYLERILNHPVYWQKDVPFDDRLVTMLTICYRCHPAILRFPSITFYHSKVQSAFEDVTSSAFDNCSWLPQEGFPIVFDGVLGEEQREENSPSWFNAAEVIKVCQHLKNIYQHGLAADEVGIIAPYKKQVEKIRILINAFNLDMCKVGSVEEFQGQERAAIIISTSRSSEELIQSDNIHNIGFLCNPKRFNVATTRAKDLLIVVGNPHVLSCVPFWRDFIRYCRKNGGYIGCDITELLDGNQNA